MCARYHPYRALRTVPTLNIPHLHCLTPAPPPCLFQTSCSWNHAVCRLPRLKTFTQHHIHSPFTSLCGRTTNFLLPWKEAPSRCTTPCLSPPKDIWALPSLAMVSRATTHWCAGACVDTSLQLIRQGWLDQVAETTFSSVRNGHIVARCH